MFKNILCPTDFSDTSLNAAHKAMDIAEHFDSKITFIHVIDVNVLRDIGDLSFGSIDEFELLVTEEKPILNNLKEECEKRHIKVETVLTHGVPSDAITNKVKSGNFDLIIMGTHGHKGLKRVILGSVAESVIRNTTIPVLLYKLDSK